MDGNFNSIRERRHKTVGHSVWLCSGGIKDVDFSINAPSSVGYSDTEQRVEGR